MITLAVSEIELTRNYETIMPEIDKLSLKRRYKIWETWPEFVRSAGSWELLRKIHIALFEGLFDFAGNIRTVNISKGGFRFANALFLNDILPIISRMLQNNFDEILNKYIEMNIAHPFKEGNGRAMKLWLNSILERELNTRINWAEISRDDYFSAIQRSPVNPLELEVLLQKSFIKRENLNDEVIFMSGLSASYRYEML